MSAPPGIAPTTEPPVEQISGDRDTDLSTKSARERFIVRELGITFPQAKRLIAAYEADLREQVIKADSERMFYAWLMTRKPGEFWAVVTDDD